MAIILDRTNRDKNQSAENRRRFIKRYKNQLRDAVHNSTHKQKISNIGKKRKVKIKGNSISEPMFRQGDGGTRSKVHVGNKKYTKGTQIPRPKGGQSQRGGTDGADGSESFQFTLTKEEFFELYFNDMALPDFIKKGLNSETVFEYKRAGYTKEGNYSKLDIKKTFEQSLARKIASKKEKPRFLEDVDLRFRNYTKQPVVVQKAVMICLMDVSGSMSQSMKDLARRFYLLLYLFLEKEYNAVELRFITYTTTAQEVTEEDFFYGTLTGGTSVIAGLKKVHSVIDEYELSKNNIYLAMVSDGDYFGPEEDDICQLLFDLKDKLQYMAYIQVPYHQPASLFSTAYSDEEYGLLALINTLTKYLTKSDGSSKIQGRQIATPEDVYPVLHDLFKK